MTFYNKKIQPQPFGGIKIQDFGNTPTSQKIARHHGVGGSETYAVNKDAILCFACDYDYDGNKSQRVVTFKAFINDFQINNTIGRTDIDNNKPYNVEYLNHFRYNYKLSFDVPAHSVNEAISNMARFSELERILTYPFVGNTNPSDPNGYRFPQSYILFSNLINSGQYWERFASKDPFSYTFNRIRKDGLRGVVKNINMTPDLEMGVFEFNNQTYFKSFSIDLDIAIPNTLFHINRSREGYNTGMVQNQLIVPLILTEDGNEKAYIYADIDTVKDTKGFPFNIPLTTYSPGVGLDPRTLNSNNNWPTTQYANNKKSIFSICPSNNKLKGPYAENLNVLKFLGFLESFSYSKEQNVKEFEGATTNQSEPIFIGTSKINFQFKLNIVADSVQDALKNAAKISLLFRMVVLGEGIKNKILLSNLLKSAKSTGRANNYSLANTLATGLEVSVYSCAIKIDTELGFFEYNSFFVPKAFSLDFDTRVQNTDVGKLIISDTDGENKSFQATTDSIYWPFGINYDNV